VDLITQCALRWRDIPSQVLAFEASIANKNGHRWTLDDYRAFEASETMSMLVAAAAKEQWHHTIYYLSAHPRYK
jgi:hypothetical protein